MINDDDVFDQMAHHDSHFGDFAKTAGAAGVGYLLGRMLSQTRFGQWFEHSPVIGWILSIVLLALGVYALYCIGCFILVFGAAIIGG